MEDAHSTYGVDYATCRRNVREGVVDAAIAMLRHVAKALLNDVLGGQISTYDASQVFKSLMSCGMHVMDIEDIWKRLLREYNKKAEVHTFLNYVVDHLYDDDTGTLLGLADSLIHHRVDALIERLYRNVADKDSCCHIVIECFYNCLPNMFEKHLQHFLKSATDSHVMMLCKNIANRERGLSGNVKNRMNSYARMVNEFIRQIIPKLESVGIDITESTKLMNEQSLLEFVASWPFVMKALINVVKYFPVLDRKCLVLAARYSCIDVFRYLLRLGVQVDGHYETIARVLGIDHPFPANVLLCAVALNRSPRIARYLLKHLDCFPQEAINLWLGDESIRYIIMVVTQTALPIRSILQRLLLLEQAIGPVFRRVYEYPIYNINGSPTELARCLVSATGMWFTGPEATNALISGVDWEFVWEHTRKDASLWWRIFCDVTYNCNRCMNDDSMYKLMEHIALNYPVSKMDTNTAANVIDTMFYPIGNCRDGCDACAANMDDDWKKRISIFKRILVGNPDIVLKVIAELADASEYGHKDLRKANLTMLPISWRTLELTGALSKVFDQLERTGTFAASYISRTLQEELRALSYVPPPPETMGTYDTGLVSNFFPQGGHAYVATQEDYHRGQ
jgi:hypothetical protein